VAFALGLLIALSIGNRLVKYFASQSLVQTAYEDAPSSHATKTGTPTLGGVLFILAVLASWLVWRDDLTLSLTILMLGCGLIGLIDDLTSIKKGRNRGMRGRTKFAATGLVAIVFLIPALCSVESHRGLIENATILGVFVFPHVPVFLPLWGWLILSFVTILATTHAVNLTDGLDGLAAGSLIPPLAVFAWLAWQYGYGYKAVSIVDVTVIGALLGFLYFNRYPAKLIMGDTGSLALGGILAGSAILLGMQLMLIVIGFVFVAETLSVILQVASFKLTGKRIFRMSPLHHHFELAGWPETKVTHRFWAASALCSLIGVALLKFGVAR